jgi:hypothetical protein
VAQPQAAGALLLLPLISAGLANEGEGSAGEIQGRRCGAGQRRKPQGEHGGSTTTKPDVDAYNTNIWNSRDNVINVVHVEKSGHEFF